MRTRHGLLLGGGALGIGVLGFVLGIQAGGDGARTRAPATLRTDPVAARPHKPVERPPRATAPAVDPRRPDRPGERERRLRDSLEGYLESLQVPDAVRAEAEELGVATRVVHMAFAAEWWLHVRQQFPGPAEEEGVRAALAELAAEGEQGFLAILSLIRGHGFGTHYTPLVEATWRPGLERRLFDAVDVLLPRGGAVHQVYAALGAIDTDDVRRYLRAALKRHEHHASNFAGAATALGMLGDRESVPAVAGALRKDSWVGLRPALLAALGDMGGDEARDVLLDYLRRTDANLESYAVRALAGIDPALARAEAEALLAGGEGGNRIDPVERQRLGVFLAEAD